MNKARIRHLFKELLKMDRGMEKVATKNDLEKLLDMINSVDLVTKILTLMGEELRRIKAKIDKTKEGDAK